MYYLIACQIVNLLAVCVASLALVIFYSYFQIRPIMKWAAFLLIELNLTALSVLLKPVVDFYPTVKKLLYLSVGIRLIVLTALCSSGFDWYFSVGIIASEALTWAKLGFVLLVATKKPGCYKMILGYKSVSGQDSI